MSDHATPTAPDGAPTMPLPHADAHAPGWCENCGAALQGEYCHACGQAIHNPIRHAGHALEEVFESFWHLDGRIFRTLRDLLVPGRVACNYLAGHRVRYVAPLRLFVILSVLTFFVAQYAVHFKLGPQALDGGGLVVDADNSDAFAALDTVAEVERLRDRQLERLRDVVASAPMSAVPALRTGMEQSADAVRQRAQQRIDQLQGAQQRDAPSPQAAGSRVSGSPGTPPPAATRGATPPDASRPAGAPGLVLDDNDLRFNDRPWHETENPLRVSWLPGFANAWLNHQVARAKANVPRFNSDPELYKTAVLKSVPSALFLLVPVFALLLKLAYALRGRLYLEHLVVALYSHAFLCVALLAIAVLSLAIGWSDAHATWLATPLSILRGLAWASMPAYLLLMQKRVYAQGWAVTLLKYATMGTLYVVLVSFAAVGVALLSLARA